MGSIEPIDSGPLSLQTAVFVGVSKVQGRGFNSHRFHHPFFVLPLIWASPSAQQTPKRVWAEESLLRGSTGARHWRAVLVGALMAGTFGRHLYELGGARARIARRHREPQCSIGQYDLNQRRGVSVGERVTDHPPRFVSLPIPVGAAVAWVRKLGHGVTGTLV